MTIDEKKDALVKYRLEQAKEALKTWRRGQVEQELIDGYRAMAKEDKKTAEQNLEAGKEAIIK